MFCLFICNSNFLNFQLPVQWCGSRNSQFLIAAGSMGRGEGGGVWKGVAPRPDNAVGGQGWQPFVPALRPIPAGHAPLGAVCARSVLVLLYSN